MGMVPGAELIRDLLPRLRDEAGLSLSQLSIRSGVGEGTIKQILKKQHAGRVPDADILERLAGALEVEPSVFYEYPIAVARRDAKAAAEKRMADSVGEEARRSREHPPVAPRTSRGDRGRRSQGQG